MKFDTLPLMLSTVAASFTADLNIQLCDQQGCKVAPKRIALDATSNGTESLITVVDDALTMKYGGPDVGGPRVYLIEEEGVNKNTMFMLNGQEFTFDVELSTMSCGFNAALYFIGMTENDGGAQDGTKYCDAQAVGGTFCSEMDLFEGNTVAQQYTTHGCVDACATYTEGVSQCELTSSPKSVCDQSGCGLNPFRYGPGTTYDVETNNAAWHGPGSSFQIDTTKPFTVTTQFHDTNITRFYFQQGKRVDLPTLYVRTPTDGKHYGAFENPALREDFCVDIYDRWDEDGSKPLSQMFNNMENGMVLAMSAWYAQETYVNGLPTGTQTGMSWMDGINKWSNDHYTKVGPCHETTSDSGDHQATFSNIRFGSIGSTLPTPSPTPVPPPVPPPTPSEGGCNDGTVIGETACGYNCDDNCNCGRCNTKPGCSSETQCLTNCNSGGNAKWCPAGAVPTPPPSPPPTPPPTPPATGCCSWDGKYCGDTTDYCKASADQCADCDGKWCTDCLPPYTTKTTTDAPSNCPGGSLGACIDMCPADAYALCVESCKRRCGGDVSV